MKLKQSQYLLKSIQQKQQLKSDIQKQINYFNDNLNRHSNQQQIQKLLKLRLSLIQPNNQLTAIRIEHLERIFNHYCTHIFKTGKYMTFQRLQYEKVHLTMDRMFIFFKDFSLLQAQINKNQQQILDKVSVIRVFKKISSNSRDLSFEEFICMIEQIAEMYWDQKQKYQNKKLFQRQKKEKIKRQNKQRIKMKQKRMKNYHQYYEQKNNIKNIDQDQQSKKNDEKYIQIITKTQTNKNKQDQQSNQKNQIIKDNQIEQNKNNQQNEIKQEKINKQEIIAQNVQQIHEIQQQQNSKLNQSKLQKQIKCNQQTNQNQIQKEEQYCHQQIQLQNTMNSQYLELTVEQKIQYFYRLIDVDNVKSFRSKMRQLNLPIFCKPKQGQKKKIDTNINEKNSSIQELCQDSQLLRRQNLHNKLIQMKQRQKNNSNISINLQAYKNSKQEKKIKNQKPKTKIQSPITYHINKKSDLTQRQISFKALRNISLDRIQLNQSLYKLDQQDKLYLKEYQIKEHKNQNSQYKSQNNKKHENGLNLVEKIKNRVKEVKKQDEIKNYQRMKKVKIQNQFKFINKINEKHNKYTQK